MIRFMLPLLGALFGSTVLCASQRNEDVFRKVSVVFRSYSGDIDLAPVAVESAMKYVSLAKSFTVVVPELDFDLFERKFNNSYPHIINDDRFSLRPEKKLLKDDRMQQKLSKMLADTYCRGKFILHVDSDMIFRRQLLASDVMFKGKPLLFFQEAKSLPFEVAWPIGTSTALGRTTPYEFSRTALKLFPRVLYEPARQHLEKTHGMSIVEFLDKRVAVHDVNEGPRLFSDFNYLGAYGFYNMRELFSLNPLDEELRAKLEPADLPPHPLYDISCQGNGQAARFTGTMNETLALLRTTWQRGLSCADLITLADLYHHVSSPWFSMHRFVCVDKLFSKDIEQALPCDGFRAMHITIPKYDKWGDCGRNDFTYWPVREGGRVQCAPVPASTDVKMTPILMEIPSSNGTMMSVHQTHIRCFINFMWRLYPLPMEGGSPSWKFNQEVLIHGGFQIVEK